MWIPDGWTDCPATYSAEDVDQVLANYEESRTMRTPIRLATAVVALSLLSACGSTGNDSTSPDSFSGQQHAEAGDPADEAHADLGHGNSPWSTHHLDRWEAESYDSLGDLVHAADLIAVGTVVDVRPGPTWVESEGDETMTSEISAYTVELTDVLSGRPVGSMPGEITLEFGPNSPDTVAARTAVVGESSLFILRRKGAPIPSVGRLEPMKEDFAREVYRVVNSTGLIDDVDGSAAVPLGDSDLAWTADVERGSFTDAVERVRRALS